MTCYTCGRPIEQGSLPPKLLYPAYFFLLVCCYQSKNMWSWRTWVNPLSGFLGEVTIGKTPICRKCCRTLSLVSIAVYLLVLGPFIMIALAELRPH